MVKNYSKIALTLLCASFFWGNSFALQQETTKTLSKLAEVLEKYPQDTNDDKMPKTSEGVIKMGIELATALYKNYLYFKVRIAEEGEGIETLKQDSAYAKYLFLTGPQPLCSQLSTNLKPVVENDLKTGTYTTYHNFKEPIAKYIQKRINESVTLSSFNHSERWARAMTLINYFRPFLTDSQVNGLIDGNYTAIKNDNYAFKTQWKQLCDCAKALYQAKTDPDTAQGFVDTFVYNSNGYSFMQIYQILYTLESSDSNPIKELAGVGVVYDTGLRKVLEEKKDELKSNVINNTSVRTDLLSADYFGITDEGLPGKAFDIIGKHYVPASYVKAAHKAVVWGFDLILDDTDFLYAEKYFRHNLPECIRKIKEALEEGDMSKVVKVKTKDGKTQSMSYWQMFKVMLAGSIISQAVGRSIAAGERAVSN